MREMILRSTAPRSVLITSRHARMKSGKPPLRSKPDHLHPSSACPKLGHATAIASTHEVIAAGSGPLKSTPKLLASGRKPLMEAPKPFAGARNPVMDRSKPFAGGRNPLIGHKNRVAGGRK